MVFRERTYSVLIASASEKFADSIAALLPSTDHWPVNKVSSAGEARRASLETPYDLVLINSPLNDEFGSMLACDIADSTSSGVLIFVKNEVYEDVYNKVMENGVMVVSKPISTQMVVQTLKMMCAARERLRCMEKKQATVEEKIKEIRLVNKAKWVLIENLSMTEADAHRYIEKQAMDMRLSKQQIAENIIKTYK